MISKWIQTDFPLVYRQIVVPMMQQGSFLRGPSEEQNVEALRRELSRTLGREISRAEGLLDTLAETERRLGNGA